jgi:hypothetical protein
MTQQSNSSFWYILKKYDITMSTKYLHSHIYYSTIHNNQDTETTLSVYWQKNEWSNCGMCTIKYYLALKDMISFVITLLSVKSQTQKDK